MHRFLLHLKYFVIMILILLAPFSPVQFYFQSLYQMNIPLMQLTVPFQSVYPFILNFFLKVFWILLNIAPFLSFF